MNNEEMFLTILNRMDSMESGISGLNGRMDKLESNMNLEFYAVRKEMDVMNKSLQKQINVLSSKVDRIVLTKDVEGYDKHTSRGVRKRISRLERKNHLVRM